MTRINGPRIFLGGLLAGVVINTFEFVTNFFVINDDWLAAKELDPTVVAPPLTGLEVAALNLWGFLVGLLAVWLYAAIRDTYGQGPKTAIKAGTGVWVLTVLVVVLRPSVGPGLPVRADLIAAGVGWLEITLGTVLGAWQYRVRTDRVAAAPDIRG